MGLEVERDTTALEPFEQVHLPERFIARQTLDVQLADLVEQILKSGAALEAHPVHLLGGIDGLVEFELWQEGERAALEAKIERRADRALQHAPQHRTCKCPLRP